LRSRVPMELVLRKPGIEDFEKISATEQPKQL
jgi:hypothetical protein